MSTVTGPKPGPGRHSEEDDPFRHGVRHVPRTLDDGTVVYDQIPLRQEDLLFPEEWDRHVITDGHRLDCNYLQNAFAVQVQGDATARVLGDLRVDWSHPEIQPLGPDVILVTGVNGRRDWTTFNVVAEGAATPLVVEVTSPDTRNNDLVVKRDLYFRLGVAYYAVVDRHVRRSGVEVSVTGWHRGESAFEELPRDARGRIWLEPVRVWLGVEGERAICYLADGTPIPDYPALAHALSDTEQRVQSERKAAKAERRRAAAERKRAEAERERADAERERADTEARARAELEQRLRDTEAELRRLRGEA